MAVCTVTLSTDKAAISGAVVYEPLPGQIVNNVFIDTSDVTATVFTDTSYTAALNQKVQYRIKAPRFPFNNEIFTAPATSTANLYDLLEGYRAG